MSEGGDMSSRFGRMTRRLERAVLGAAMVGIGWFLERRLVRVVGRRAS